MSEMIFYSVKEQPFEMFGVYDTGDGFYIMASYIGDVIAKVMKL